MGRDEEIEAVVGELLGQLEATGGRVKAASP